MATNGYAPALAAALLAALASATLPGGAPAFGGAEGAAAAASSSATAAAAPSPAPAPLGRPAGVGAPYINTWLVCGTFDNARDNSGFEHDWVGEADAAPHPGQGVAGHAWHFFDDRLFSRNYDDYQDLFSYFRVKRGESIAAKVAYAFAYVWSPLRQAAQFRAGADNEFRAWLNGQRVAESLKGTPYRDEVEADVTLRAGWNRLLLKIGNREAGRFGFYCRLTTPDGAPPPGVFSSPTGGDGPLAVATRPMPEAHTGDLPVAYREWPYFGCSAAQAVSPEGDNSGDTMPLRKPDIAMSASPFFLTAGGGAPPYRWSLAEGKLPAGLSLKADGAIRGTVAASARLGAYTFAARVTDTAGHTATRRLSMQLHERPNKWYEEGRLGALIHNPECLSDGQVARLARLMKRQGYCLGMVISFNNGRGICRWPSIFEPHNPLGDVVGRYKKALDAEGIRFGMYIGDLTWPNNGGDNGAILLIQDAMRRYHPAAFWFDWAGWNGVSLDAIYSMIRSYDPNTIIILNGVQTISNGDWDIVCLEGWGAWGDNLWGLWPFHLPWPKAYTMETWRMIADPDFKYSKGVEPDWRAYLRLEISLICSGYIANIDDSPTVRMGLDKSGHLPNLEDSITFRTHQKMAAWANPPGLPPLYESYTHCYPGPLAPAAWGYDTLSVDGKTLYLHILRNPRGKTGLPHSPSLTVGPLPVRALRATWMNRGKSLGLSQKGDRLTISLHGVVADPIDTIIKVELAGPCPRTRATLPPRKPIPPGNLACYKPSRLLSLDGSHGLIPSGLNMAFYGVDGNLSTVAEGANEWPWTYEVDLQAEYPVRRVVINFGRAYATEYEVRLSADHEHWVTVAHVTDCKGGRQEHTFAPVKARWVRVLGIKPNAPNQPGGQMSIAELEVYE